MTIATDNLNAKIDDLSGAVMDALTQVEAEVATIRSVRSSSDGDDTAIVNASADRIGALSGTIRTALTKARTELAAVPATGPSASKAPPVALAGVPVTPASDAGVASTGPAVPSTDATPVQDLGGTAAPAAGTATAQSIADA